MPDNAYGLLQPSQLAPCTRYHRRRSTEVDLGTDGADSTQYLITAVRRALIIPFIGYTMTETANASATNEKQQVAITGTPEGGDFKLSYGTTGTVETTALAHDIEAPALKAALEVLDAIDTVTVTGTNPTLVVEFTGTLVAGQDLEMMTLSDNSLTGGSTPTVAITEDTKGVTAADNSAIIKLGIVSETVAVDVDAICVIDVDPDAAEFSNNIVEATDFEDTLKTRYSAAGMAVVPVGYTVVANFYKNLVAGNDGKCFLDLFYCEADDPN